jgi:bacterioferritin-associated ferredoxin
VIVCHCQVVSDRDVVAAAQAGARDIADVADVCGAGSQCHGCHDRIDALLASMDRAVDQRMVLQEAS